MLRATVPADPRLVKALGEVPDVIVMIHLDADDVPTRIVASSKDDDATEEIDIALRDFGAAIDSTRRPRATSIRPRGSRRRTSSRWTRSRRSSLTALPDGYELESASVETDPEILDLRVRRGLARVRRGAARRRGSRRPSTPTCSRIWASSRSTSCRSRARSRRTRPRSTRRPADSRREQRQLHARGPGGRHGGAGRNDARRR